MVDPSARVTTLNRPDDGIVARSIARSARTVHSPLSDLAGVHCWLAELTAHSFTNVEPVPLDAMDQWHRDRRTGNIAHRSGKFFTVEGLRVDNPDGPVRKWNQPIINQPEVGILGILVQVFDGVLHCLMQAKVEPGNCNGLQLSPTVQATRSNYTRVHQGKPVPYLEYFRDSARHRVIADVRQSEQGAWFYRKQNRNVIVETTETVEVQDGFRWMTIGQVHALLELDDMINMDARTVLSCLPFSAEQPDAEAAVDGFRGALARSCAGTSGSVHPDEQIRSWITDSRSRSDIQVERVPLNDLEDWQFSEGKVVHRDGLFFDVMGVDVSAGGREVARWSQPMIQPHGVGVVAFLVREFESVLHVLVGTRVEPGYTDVVELAPTVQCTPLTYEQLPAEARPAFLDTVLAAPQDAIRFDAVHSEEGGRFYHARNRYLVVEVGQEFSMEDPDFRWMTVHQLIDLLRHSHYLNVQARSLVACLHSCLAIRPAGAAEGLAGSSPSVGHGQDGEI